MNDQISLAGASGSSSHQTKSQPVQPTGGNTVDTAQPLNSVESNAQIGPLGKYSSRLLLVLPLLAGIAVGFAFHEFNVLNAEGINAAFENALAGYAVGFVGGAGTVYLIHFLTKKYGSDDLVKLQEGIIGKEKFLGSKMLALGATSLVPLFGQVFTLMVINDTWSDGDFRDAGLPVVG